ncbi:MAG: hypothetical protein ACKVPJ_02620 [Chitinophagales bacterium]
MEQIVWIIVAILWLVISGINKNKKEQQKQKQRQGEQQPVPPASNTDQKQPETIKDIFEELRRQMKEVNETQPENPIPQPVKPVRQVKQQRNREVTNRQIIIEDREVISERERQSALEYEAFVAKARLKQHDAKKYHMEEQVMEVTEDVIYEPVDLDLRNLIIADAILRRPEY